MKVIPFAQNYAVSEDGQIYSKNKSRSGDYKIMTGVRDTSTYYRLNITTDNDGVKKFLVHRLVAICYLPNPLNLPEVNHKDGNKLNNNVNNLEWVTRSENALHMYRILKTHKPVWNIKRWKDNKKIKIVLQYNCINKLINTYFWTREAERLTWIKQSQISWCCLWKNKSAWWFIWRYL